MSEHRWICLDCYRGERWLSEHPLGDGHYERPCDACGRKTVFGERKFVGPHCMRMEEGLGSSCDFCGDSSWSLLRVGGKTYEVCRDDPSCIKAAIAAARAS